MKTLSALFIALLLVLPAVVLASGMGGGPFPGFSASAPAMDGAGSAGSTGLASDAGHVHPTDTSRAPDTIYDYAYLPVGSANASALGAPDAATVAQGAIGSNLITGWSNSVPAWETFTSSGANVTSAINTAGTTEQGDTNSTGLVVGKLYQLVVNLTVGSGTPPKVCIGTGAENLSLTTLSAGVNTYTFRCVASGSTKDKVWFHSDYTFNGSATFTLYEYTQPENVREFSSSTQQTLVFDWLPPLDWDGGTVYFRPVGVISQPTPPTNTQTVITQVSAFVTAGSDSTSQAIGTSVTSTFTADATYAQYDRVVFPLSAAVTVANSPAAGKPVKLVLDRLTSGTYAQKMGISGIWLKYGRVLGH